MVKPPKLGINDLSTLLSSVGGTKRATQILDITPRTLQRWESEERVPAMALHLLWYASPAGRYAFECDLHFGSNLLHTQKESYRRECERLRDLLQRNDGKPLAVPLEALEEVSANDQYGAMPPQPPAPAVRRFK